MRTPSVNVHGSVSGPAGPVASGTSGILWGFDDIGVRGRDCWNQGCLMSHPQAGALIREFGFNLWVTWYPDGAERWGTHGNRAYIRCIDRWCMDHGLHWLLNQLATAWNNSPATAVDPDGYDWFNREDGRRFLRFPDPILDELQHCSRLMGLVYDEAEHHQNNANVVPGLDVPSIYDPSGDTLATAAAGHVRAAGGVVQDHARFGLRLYTEQVLPVMVHTFARAGFTPSVKFLKESWCPVYAACALGAVRQYGCPFWVTIDLWGTKGYLTHGPRAYSDALLLAYHLGADAIYTESLALDEGGHGTGSLVYMTPDTYRVTEYGHVAKQFRESCLLNGDRPYTAAQVRPRVAIVRREDGYWGQAAADLPWFTQRLFGHPEWRAGPESKAWIEIWHLLTRGAVPPDSLVWWGDSYRDREYQVLCPVDGVVVYDDHAVDEHFDGVEVIFLTGVGVSVETRAAVTRRVREGALCVALPHLLPERARGRAESGVPMPDGDGTWLCTDSFLSEPVRRAVAHVLPEDDAVRYRFADREVALRPGTTPDSGLRVEVRRAPVR